MSQPSGHFAPALEKIAQLVEKDESSDVVLLRQRNEVLAHQAFGVATRRWNVPVTTSTRFDTASITKLFTAVAVLQQVDACT